VIYRFDRFQADDTAFRLTADGAPVALEPKVLRLLLYLIQNRGRLVRKQELLDGVWQETAVSENALTRSIGLLRKALHDDSREPRFIETVPTAGYRFIAQVETISPPQASAEPAAFVLQSVPTAAQPAPPAAAKRRILRLGAIVCCGLLLLAAVFWGVAARLRPAPAIRSLAVLPLTNLSGDPSQDYFADGMTDELITQFAHIPNLRVVSRTSVMADRGAKRPLPEIARALGVDAIVEGSTVRSGDRVRITAQLIDARTDRHLWAQSFEGSANDVLGLQDSVAQQIATKARLVLLPAPPRRKGNPMAEDAILRGRYFFNKQDFSHSLEYFERAISLDPNDAEAYAGYATTLDAVAAFGMERPVEAMPKALAAAQRAIELDPNSGEAYTELGSIQTIFTWDWAAAEENLKRGISLSPNDSIAEFKYAIYLDATGQPQDAVAHMKRALDLDPLSFLMNRRMGATLYLAREYDAALTQLQRAAEMEERPASVERYVSRVYEGKGERDLAVQHDLLALRADFPAVGTAALSSAYARSGWRGYWSARANALRNAAADPCKAYEIGTDQLRAKDTEPAFQELGKAVDEHCFPVALMRVDPVLDGVRGDPRYAALLQRMHP
jgi:TolB-like protein/DNA-binding winged helix-turn-helix (wHTH) protein/Tfp pilus assembly protein PilF